MNMRILIIKLSSIGDLIHTFPAIVDANTKIKNIIIDWVVDEDFIGVVELQQQFCHNRSKDLINKIIALPLRKLKSNFWREIFKFPIKKLIKNLRTEKYDLIIDAQGLLKSAIVARLASSLMISGFDFYSAKEPIASFLYDDKLKISKEWHAIRRLRELFANSLNYKYDPELIDYGFNRQNFINSFNTVPINDTKYIVLLHGTTWETKHWPEGSWIELANLLSKQQFKIVIMTYGKKQQEFADRLLISNPEIKILSNLNFNQIAVVIANSIGVVAVDTGFAHLAASLNVPIIAIYGATSSIKSGVLGTNSINLQSKYHCSPCLAKFCIEYKNGKSKIKQPCLQEITPEIIMQELNKFISS